MYGSDGKLELLAISGHEGTVQIKYLLELRLRTHLLTVATHDGSYYLSLLRMRIKEHRVHRKYFDMSNYRTNKNMRSGHYNSIGSITF